MTGADGTYDYKAMAAGIVLAGGEGMGNLLPVVEKELLHYRILDAMMREGFFSSLVFQGGTSLRLCHGSPRYSEDLDFAGGTSFDMDTLKGLGSCISDSLSGMGDDVTVRVKEPRPDADGLTRRWRIAIRTAGQRKDLPSQTIKLEVASIPAYEPQHRPALVNYPMFPALSGQIILDVESPTEILADKLLSYACASHLRRRDLWDMCWLASRGDVDSRRAMELAELKSSDYGEEGLWADRADRVAGVADVIGSVDGTATVLATFKDNPWTGMDGVPAIVANTFGEGRSVYVGARLGREGLALSLPEILESLGMAEAGGNDGRVLHVEREGADGSRFVFSFNRTHETVRVPVEGEVVVSSFADVDGETASIKPNGVIVTKK
mgnify:CR=1 FL=1